MKSRRGEVATILTIATLVVIGVTAVVSSFNINKKQSTSSRASEACTKVSCGNLSTNASATYYQKYDTVEKMWKYYKNITTTCSAEAIEGVGKYCKSQNLAVGVECIETACTSPNANKKYHKWKDSTGGKDPSKNYSDSCQTEIPNLTTFCTTTGGNNITPIPGKNPPDWGKNMGKGCGTGENGDQNYQYGACYQGRRCVQGQSASGWLSYNTFEDDSTCTDDQVYCPGGWSKTQCVNGGHKCCNDTECLPGNKIGETPTTKKTDCLSSASQCNTANNEYCSEANNVCTTGDTLLGTVCGQNNQHCCKKTISATSCKTTGIPKNISRDGKKHCISDSATGVAESTVICIEGNEFAVEFGCPADSTYTGECVSVSGGDAKCEKTTDITSGAACSGTAYSHSCTQYCSDAKKTGGNATSYAYTGTGDNVKFWTDATCAKTFDPTTSCGCGDPLPISSCDFGGGIVVQPGKTSCKNNIVYSCDAEGKKIDPDPCDQGWMCDTVSPSIKCINSGGGTMGTTTCYKADGSRAACSPTVGSIKSIYSCITMGKQGKYTFSTVCGSEKKGYACEYKCLNSFNDWIDECTGNVSEDQDRVCILNDVQSMKVSLTIDNIGELAKYSLTTSRLEICLNPGSNCKPFSLPQDGSNVVTATFDIKDTDTYTATTGYLIDSANNVYQDTQAVNLGGGYLLVDHALKINLQHVTGVMK